MKAQMPKSGESRSTMHKRRQRGVALVELLLVTVPLCCLSIVLASAISATATARNQSMWKASLKTQQATREPCGGSSLADQPATSPSYASYIAGKQLAQRIVQIEVDTTNLLQTNSITESDTEQAPSFYFEKAADKMFPSRIKSASNSATFLCNEPDGGNVRRDMLKAPLLDLAHKTSQEMY